MLPISSTVDRAARLLAPAPEQFAALLVEVGERQALAAALRRRADLGHLHQRIPEAGPLMRTFDRSANVAPLALTNASVNLTDRSNDLALAKRSGKRRPWIIFFAVATAAQARPSPAGRTPDHAQAATDHPRGQRARVSRGGRGDLRRTGLFRRDDVGDRPRAGVPKANIHYYFPTKEALYRAVVERVLTAWLDAAAPSTPATIRARRWPPISAPRWTSRARCRSPRGSSRPRSCAARR